MRLVTHSFGLTFPSYYNTITIHYIIYCKKHCTRTRNATILMLKVHNLVVCFLFHFYFYFHFQFSVPDRKREPFSMSMIRTSYQVISTTEPCT